MVVSNRNLLFQRSIFRCYVSFYIFFGGGWSTLRPLKEQTLRKFVMKIHSWGSPRKAIVFKENSSDLTWRWFTCKWEPWQQESVFWKASFSFIFRFHARWWFQTFYLCLSLPGEDFHFDEYFSNGLKPPTSMSFSWGCNSSPPIWSPLLKT